MCVCVTLLGVANTLSLSPARKQDPRAMRGPRGPRVTVVPAVLPAPRVLLVHRDQWVQKEVRMLALQDPLDPWVHPVRLAIMDARTL